MYNQNKLYAINAISMEGHARIQKILSEGGDFSGGGGPDPLSPTLDPHMKAVYNIGGSKMKTEGFVIRSVDLQIHQHLVPR